jgi:hypothetical protein
MNCQEKSRHCAADFKAKLHEEREEHYRKAFPCADYLQGSFTQMVQSPAIEKESLCVL